MSIIDYTYFFGKLNLPQSGNTEGRTLITQFIDIYEPEYLKKALGYDLWKAFSEGIAGTGLGSEQITNGSFTGNANDWTLGTGWSFNVDKVTFTNISGASALYQLGVLSTTKKYRVSFDVTTTNGFVNVQFGNNRIEAVVGTNTFDGYWADVLGHGGIIVYFMVSTDFDGSIDNVSVKEITTEQRWLDLLEGKEFEYLSRNYNWNGFNPTEKITPIANYVYYKYMEDRASDNTLVGTAAGAVDNNTRTAPVTKMVDAWNAMAEMDKTLWHFLKVNKDVYPEWTNFQWSWDYWWRSDSCKRSEVFHFKNSLDL